MQEMVYRLRPDIHSAFRQAVLGLNFPNILRSGYPPSWQGLVLVDDALGKIRRLRQIPTNSLREQGSRRRGIQEDLQGQNEKRVGQRQTKQLRRFCQSSRQIQALHQRSQAKTGEGVAS